LLHYNHTVSPADEFTQVIEMSWDGWGAEQSGYARKTMRAQVNQIADLLT